MAIIKRKKYNTLDVKCALINYFVWKRNMLCVDELTMFGGFIADIIADNESNIVYEIEIKTNIHDLMINEIKNKKKKHDLYKNCSNCSSIGVPNMFYFCVPMNMIKECEQLVDELNPNYGILKYGVDYGDYGEHLISQDKISVHRQAKRIKLNYNTMIDKINKKLKYEVSTRVDLQVKFNNIKMELSK